MGVGRAVGFELAEEVAGLVDGGGEHVGDAPGEVGATGRGEFYFERVGPVAFSVAIGAADEDVAQKLHLDFLEAGSVAFLTLAGGGVEAEEAGGKLEFTGFDGAGEKIADRVKGSHVKGRGGARCPAQG